MRIIAVDDEEIALESLESAIREASPSAEVAVFDNGTAVLEYASGNKCEAAFLDIDLGSFNRITLAKALKLRDPEINIIFSTGYSEYAPDAFEMHASGYIMKPITAEKVRYELDGKAVYFKSVRRNLIATLKECGCGDVIIQQRGSLAIDTKKVQCDYYDWIDGKAGGINAYRGEYMYQYSWGELRHIDIE